MLMISILTASCFDPPSSSTFTRLDPINERLLQDQEAIPLRPKSFAVLQYLAERPNNLVRKEASLTISVQQDFNELMMHARFMLGCALVAGGRVAEGAEHILWSANAAQYAGVEIWRPSVLGLLAQACGESGQIEKALSMFDEALSTAARSNERFAEAELYRLKGELLLKVEDRGSRVEDCFHRAIEIARQQKAKSWELRAASSLARLLLRQGRRSEARQTLTPVYEWFTEGFDTADLKDARALLDELS